MSYAKFPKWNLQSPPPTLRRRTKWHRRRCERRKSWRDKNFKHFSEAICFFESLRWNCLSCQRRWWSERGDGKTSNKFAEHSDVKWNFTPKKISQENIFFPTNSFMATTNFFLLSSHFGFSPLRVLIIQRSDTDGSLLIQRLFLPRHPFPINHSAMLSTIFLFPKKGSLNITYNWGCVKKFTVDGQRHERDGDAEEEQMNRETQSCHCCFICLASCQHLS